MNHRRLFVSLYAASGAAALVYEVTWTRLLTLQLGHTVVLYAMNTAGAAAGAIAAGFFLIPAIGLRATTWIGVALNLIAAAGAWWLGSRSENTAEIAEHAEKPFLRKKKKTDPPRSLRS